MTLGCLACTDPCKPVLWTQEERQEPVLNGADTAKGQDSTGLLGAWGEGAPSCPGSGLEGRGLQVKGIAPVGGGRCMCTRIMF